MLSAPLTACSLDAVSATTIASHRNIEANSRTTPKKARAASGPWVKRKPARWATAVVTTATIRTRTRSPASLPVRTESLPMSIARNRSTRPVLRSVWKPMPVPTAP